MNPPLNLAGALTQLKLYTDQTANFTFTDDEITQALQSAWNDAYVVNQVWDSSLTYTSSSWQYAIPATLDTVRGIYIKRSTSDNPEPVSPDLYSIVAGYIQFNRIAQAALTDTYTLYIKGNYKLATTDSLVTQNQVNYVINLAAELLLNNLILKRAFVFLKNDTTMGDAVGALRVVQGNVLRYKQAILREFEEA